MSSVGVKICGLSTPETIQAAVDAGTDMIGLMFFPKSPRNVSIADAAVLRKLIPPHVKTVAVMVDPDDALLDAVTMQVDPDVLQLHGAETPGRVRTIRAATGLQVMKVLSVATAEDVGAKDPYENVADLLLFDAKPPKSMANALPGGNALSFDWTLLNGLTTPLPWMLSGGLNPDNVSEAIAVTGAGMVDVSSGVEEAPGQKNEALIRAFITAAKSADV